MSFMHSFWIVINFDNCIAVMWTLIILSSNINVPFFCPEFFKHLYDYFSISTDSLSFRTKVVTKISIHMDFVSTIIFLRFHSQLVSTLLKWIISWPLTVSLNFWRIDNGSVNCNVLFDYETTNCHWI